MQKWTALLFVVLVLGAVGVVVRAGMQRNAKSTAEPVATAAASASTPPDAGPADAGTPEPSDAEAPADQDPTTQTDAGGTLLLNGDAPPALAAEAPKSVVFGVILVQYKGAQGAPTNARSMEEAQKDFKAAVAKGDKVSMENAGRLPRGILEPAPEFELFSLAKGGVSQPVDTPRGYWIVTRID